METLFTSVIAATVTLFFVRRHLKAMPPAKAVVRTARRKPALPIPNMRIESSAQ